MCLVNSVRSSSLIVCDTLAEDPCIWIRPPTLLLDACPAAEGLAALPLLGPLDEGACDDDDALRNREMSCHGVSDMLRITFLRSVQRCHNETYIDIVIQLHSSSAVQIHRSQGLPHGIVRLSFGLLCRLDDGGLVEVAFVVDIQLPKSIL